MHKVYITPNGQNYGRQGAELINSILLAQRAEFHIISLSGGSTPWPVYTELLSSLQHAKPHFKSLFIQTDERMVSADSARSNQSAIIASLLRDHPESHGNFIAAPIESPDICNGYARLIAQKIPSGRWPEQISLAVLGLGPDGHIASLFPDTDWENADSPSGFIIVNSASQPEPRLSLTFSTILKARDILFLVTGNGKKEILEEILINSESRLPAAKLVRSRQVTFSLTEDALSAKLFNHLSQKNCISGI